jgi:uncharacterized protein (TIGR04141 family)
LQCIYAEITLEDELYLLSGGKWYCVAGNFRKRIESYVKEIALCEREFPAYNDANEGAYNTRVAAENSREIACLDCKLISVPDRANSIEFCDLLTTEREVIHVKRYGGSAPLSHLFAQGSVSGQLLISDAGFRRSVNNLVERRFRIPSSRPTASDYTIVFAIISRSAKPLTLPFFSKVNLRNAHRTLTGLGFGVRLAKIPNLVQK